MVDRSRDIERYVNGEMTPAERHALEKAALSDPFLADALEGAESGAAHFHEDVQELESAVYARSRRRKKPRTISLWNWSLGIAAGLIALAVSSIFIIDRINKDRRAHELAILERKSMEELELIRGYATSDSLVVRLPQTSQGRVRSRGTESAVRIVAHHARIASNVRQREVAANLTPAPEVHEEAAAVVPEATETVQPLTRRVTGKVTAIEDGAALQGVNVMLKGTSVGTITDEMGVYVIEVPQADAALVFSFIGLETKEVSVENARANLDVKLNEDYAELSEVVVTGFNARSTEHPLVEFAEPSGGRKAFKRYLEREMQYPKQALDNKVEGKVTVQFTVEINGQVGDFKVVKGIGYGCEEELIRLIKQGPAWNPTRKNDQPVSGKVSVRLKFELPQ